MRINSFFIKNRKRDSDSRFKANFNPIFENNLMFCPIFIVCASIDASKGEKNGTGLAYRKISLLEQKMRSTSDKIKYENTPSREIDSGCFPQSRCKRTSAMNVEG